MTFRLGLAVFLGCALAALWENRKLRLLTPLLALILIKVWYVNFLELDSFRQNYLAREISNGNFISELAKLPAKSTVIVNVSQDNVEAHEWITRIPEYLNVFYGRNDIKIKFIEKGAGDYYASWSEYYLYSETKFSGEFFESKEFARPLAVSLKNWVLHPKTARSEKVYSWKLFKTADLPGEGFGATEETGF